MHGLMMQSSLTLKSVMRYAEKVYPNVEIVSVTQDNPRHRYTFREAFQRSRQLANALDKHGFSEGDRIATLAWNDYRHFELYYGISCSGYVCHTINPRLFPEQLDYIINHANDQFIFADPMFLPLLEKLQDKIKGVKGIVLLTDDANMPETILEVQSYESFIGSESIEFDFPVLDENSASSLCYTSGTTGNPKGVLYSHRSTILHGISSSLPNGFNIGLTETVMPVVPMFHVNAWALPYSCAIAGAKIVFPGNKMADGEVLTDLINSEGVTLSAGVPTVWLALYNYLQETGKTIESAKRFIVGGAACPLSLMKGFDQYGVALQTAWGMTELSPLGSINIAKPSMGELSQEQTDQLRIKQGLPLFGVEMKIVDDADTELPWDGEASGELKVRGPWVASEYFNSDVSDAHDDNGWFATGDVVSFDEEGYMLITDRAKDVIKSGGEWISSIDLENLAADHSDILEAAVIGIPHPNWDERPVVFAVKKENSTLKESDLIDWYQGKVVRWWTPDAVVFVDSLPHTATGKLDKKVLRVDYKDMQLGV